MLIFFFFFLIAVKIIPHCFKMFRSGLYGGQSVTDYFFQCVFFYPVMVLWHWQSVWVDYHAKKNEPVANETLPRWSWKVDKISGDIFVNKFISYDKIPNSTGWNVATNHDRDSTVFCRWQQTLPDVPLSSVYIVNNLNQKETPPCCTSAHSWFEQNPISTISNLESSLHETCCHSLLVSPWLTSAFSAFHNHTETISN